MLNKAKLTSQHRKLISNGRMYASYYVRRFGGFIQRIGGAIEKAGWYLEIDEANPYKDEVVDEQL